MIYVHSYWSLSSAGGGGTLPKLTENCPSRSIIVHSEMHSLPEMIAISLLEQCSVFT